MSTQPKQNRYGVREFDLSTQRTNKRIPIDAESLTVLRSQDTAEVRLGSPTAPAIPTRDLGTIEIPERVSNIYLSNESGTGILRLLLGLEGVKASAESSGDNVDVTDRQARELGKIRSQDSNGVLIDPATDGTLSNELSREISTWSAGQIDVDVQKPSYDTTTSFTVSLSGSLESLPSNSVPAGIDVILQNDPTNSNNINVGDPGIVLEPGDAVTLDVTNTDQIQVNGTSADTLRVLFEDTV